ncbi:glycosyl transferase family 1 [Rhizobium sp. ARZ01]|uniref:glycosyl transferase family 1 n=1 Tax=Rhizobium sp. ARZ01 TaxID=2769313 RepID=UPI00177E789C|nr:glycosyl transferase family 1 [Rhizobium sp. ARZ01]MBD9375299.1 glycosyl transferase family 1 [Rhizobium sp. ARZ01]
MLRILYFAHDLADPAVRRRVLALQAGDAVVTLAGFRRGEKTGAAISGVTPIELGVTEDARFVQRIGAIAVARLRLERALQGITRPDLIIARNLEMLAIAQKAVSLLGGDVPIVYECLDIHRLLLRKDWAGRAIRAVEARLGQGVSLLVTSSPAFVENYFRPLSGIEAPVFLLENKVLELDEDAPSVPGPRCPGEDAPWRIGWFGALRCRKSLDLLSRFSRAMEGKVEIVVRGRPTYAELKDFDTFMRGEPFMSFRGAYRNPEDLGEIYSEVQFCWAIDFFEEGLNSAWLLPNRVYEGCRYGTVPIAIKGTETARYLAGKQIGLTLDNDTVASLVDLFSTVERQSYSDHFARIARQGAGHWTFGRSDCQALVHRLAKVAGSPQPAGRARALAQAATNGDRPT